MNTEKLIGCAALLAVLTSWSAVRATPTEGKPVIPGGELQILDPETKKPAGVCPLKHTNVTANIAGYINRVRVTQEFHNPTDNKIEAIYTFPLPQEAAVDDMVMLVGKRRIVGQIKPREEAREIYEAAKAGGHVASLLDQERPNIFTQSVANIEPGARVVIEISYVEKLKYEDGFFEFSFPMVVGPRYMPGAPVGQTGTGIAPDTTEVPDASKISPPVTPPGTRAGHDISITVNINTGGLPIKQIESVLHQITGNEDGGKRHPFKRTIALKNRKEIPNKDFILRYSTATDDIGDAFLVHKDERGTYFTLILQPPKRVLPEQAVPKEMIFVIDRSGSMSGFPIEKAKETMQYCIEMMNPNDTFNLHSFSGGTGRCFEKPVANNAANRAKALEYLKGLYGSGGTQMMPAIMQALGGERDPKHVRIVCFMTDGYIGNDMAIIDEIGKSVAEARVFSFGIGNSVNRFLLDNMAYAGRGEVEYVTLQSQGEGAAERFHERIGAPVLTHIDIDWGDLQVDEVYPQRMPDLFSSKPIMVHGRLKGDTAGDVTLRGMTAGKPFERKVAVKPADAQENLDTMATLWARAKVKHLMHEDLRAAQSGQMPDNLKQQVTDLGVEYRMMTQFTSFVAVEELTVTSGGEPVKVTVPVEMPEGVSYEGVFGKEEMNGRVAGAARGLALRKSMRRPAPLATPLPLGELEDSDAVVPADTEPADPAELREHNLKKLVESIRDLAKEVAADGTNGNLTVDKLVVKDWKLDVIIMLRDTSKEAKDQLTKLGFQPTVATSSAAVLIGTIDVRKLHDLAQIKAVISVKPVAR